MHAQRSSYPFTIQQKFLSIHNFPQKQKHTHTYKCISYSIEFPKHLPPAFGPLSNGTSEMQKIMNNSQFSWLQWTSIVLFIVRKNHLDISLSIFEHTKARINSTFTHLSQINGKNKQIRKRYKNTYIWGAIHSSSTESRIFRIIAKPKRSSISFYYFSTYFTWGFWRKRIGSVWYVLLHMPVSKNTMIYSFFLPRGELC